jgi:putative CocE/NonD family hydrolase
LRAQDDAAKKAEPHITLSAAELDQVTGVYGNKLEAESEVSFYREGTHVFTEGARNPRVEIFAVSKDRFVAESAPLEFDFSLDASGRATAVSVKFNGQVDHTSPLVEETPRRLQHFREYVKQDVMIPARDGAKLHVVIFRPAGSESTNEALPFLMERTPYGVDDITSNGVNAMKPELAQSGYIFVFCDIRGRYGSEGQFVMNRPVVAHKSKHDVDETTDTRDTIDWLLKHVPNNSGKVGVFGVSYPGFLAMMAGIDAHPAVKAISPQAPMTDVWMGDDFFHNGAFRETYGFDYVQELEAQKTDGVVDSKEDQYNFFLSHGNFAGAAEAAKMSNLPTAKIFLTQPSYTKFWQDMAVQKRLAASKSPVEVPTLEVGGWWDQEDMWGTQAEYAALEPRDKNHEVFMVLGPWNHGGWGGPGRHLGAVQFGQPTGDEYRKTMEFPFFEKYLKGKDGFDLKGVASFRTGVDEWERYDVWPPVKGFKAEKLYLQKDHGLSFAAPTGDYETVAGAYVADPADPIPYRQRPIESTYGKGSRWRPWLVEDQRFVSSRKDLANFTTPVLDHDVTVTGDVVADLFAATTGTDEDWIVKLIDVYPDDAPAPMAGYQLMIVDEIFRGRYRKSFEVPEATKPSEVTEYKWSLHGADHTFLKGHKIMVEVQSSWFPLYDRNPQTFVPNIMTAPTDTYKAETMTVYGSPKYPSHLEFESPE